MFAAKQSKEVRDESKEVFISAQKILAKFNVFCLRRSLFARGFDVYSSLQVKPRRMFDCLGFSFDLHNRDHVKPLELLISFCFKLPGIRRILDDHVKLRRDRVMLGRSVLCFFGYCSLIT